jgi:hypothetical protein
MTTNSTTTLPASQDAAIRAVFEQTSRAWADGDADAFAARYAPEATVIMPGRYLPGMITDSITALPGEPEPPVQQHERVTWVLSRHDGHWLVEAYHSSPKHAGPSGRLPRTR